MCQGRESILLNRVILLFGSVFPLCSNISNSAVSKMNHQRKMSVLFIAIFYELLMCTQSQLPLPSRLDLGPLISVQLNPAAIALNATKCLESLGCFYNGPPFFDPIRRPISMLPFDRDALDVRFQLFTRRNPILPREISAEDVENLKNSQFEPKNQTKIVIHGLLDTVMEGLWLENIRKAFLMRSEYNVIIVDWARANRLPYEQAVANARAVGAEVALMINTLADHLEANPESFHIIGHSLGTHVAGYAGERIKGLGRITGLDPAGPYFTGTPPEVHLDKSDANFVDVIHTDSSTILVKGLGTVDSIGHADFFPNGGDRQPGCSNTMPALMSFLSKGIAEGWRRIMACDHQRAVDFFLSSISNPDCDMIGLDCPDWDTFTNGRCGDCEVDDSRCALMGMEADKYFRRSHKQRRYYLRTTGNHPFCLHQYHVTLIMEEQPKITFGAGDAFLTIEGTNVRLRARLTDRAETFRPGSYYMYLIASRTGLGEFDSATFYWEEDSKGIFQMSPLQRNISGKPRMHIRQIRISPLELKHKRGRSMKMQTMCPERKGPVFANQIVKFSYNENGNC